MIDIGATLVDLRTAAITLDGECRGEPLLGQQAVAWVIRNRAMWRPRAWWGSTPTGVCLKPHQFSCWNHDSPELDRLKKFTGDEPALAGLREICRAVFAGEVPDPTHGATMYERVGTGAKWAKNLPVAALIGHHEFFVLGPIAS